MLDTYSFFLQSNSLLKLNFFLNPHWHNYHFLRVCLFLNWTTSFDFIKSWTKYLEQSKEIQLKGSTRKLCYLLLDTFWLFLPEFHFWKEDWALGYVSNLIWDFSNIFWFHKILCLKSFSNSWGNFYTKFVTLDHKFLCYLWWIGLLLKQSKGKATFT